MSTAGNGNRLDTEVLVIGAGGAGLSLAERLAAAGIDTIVLEGRKDIGGRMRSKDVFWSRGGLPIAEGAEFIHWNPESSRTWRGILKEYDLKTDEVESNGQTLMGGKLLHDVRDAPPSSAALMEELITSIRSHFDSGGADMRVESFLRSHPLRSAPDKLRRALVRSLLSNEYAEDAGLLSIRTLLEPDSYSLKNYRIHEGFGTLISGIAGRVRDIRTGTAATLVRWQRGRVLVHTSGGSVLSAGACAITTPVGMLQSGKPAFDPALPEEKRLAIEGFLPGRITKIMMEFRERFWNPKMNFLRGGRQQLSWPPLLHHDRDAPYLSALVGGSLADVLARMGSGAAARKVAREIMAAHGIDNPKDLFINGTAVAWHQEPFIATGYSSPDVGAPLDVRERLRLPVEDTLFFAGEAASTMHPATVTGAIETGRQAADEIIASRG